MEAVLVSEAMMPGVAVLAPHQCDPPDHYCGGAFVCALCRRLVGWCFGCADELPDACDDCFCEWVEVFGEPAWTWEGT